MLTKLLSVCATISKTESEAFDTPVAGDFKIVETIAL